MSEEHGEQQSEPAVEAAIAEAETHLPEALDQHMEEAKPVHDDSRKPEGETPSPEPVPESPPPTIEDHIVGIYSDVVAGFESLGQDPRYQHLRMLAASIRDRLGRIELIRNPPKEPPVA